MRALLAGLAALAVLATGCSDGSGTAAPSPTPSGPVDPFVALEPPRTPGVGSFDAAIAQRAYEATRGLLALTLAEPASLTGAGDAALLEALAVPDPALSVAPILRTPTQKGLSVRPRFPRTVSLGTPPAEVVRSSYRADEVRGAGGEQAIRISWDGSVRYRLTVAGALHEVAYALSVGYVFALVPNEPGGIRLAQVVPGTAHAAPVIGGCLAKGLLVPAPGTPTATDFEPGPWQTPDTRTACPL